MQVNLFNSLNPNGKRVPVTITIEQVDEVSTDDGEVIYIISLHTGAKSLGGINIDPVYINNVSEFNLQEEIRKGLSIIGAQIDWSILEEDTHPPVISEIIPEAGKTNVPITSNVFIRLNDPFPASFIDADTLKFFVNNIEVTPELIVKEKNNELRVSWIPKKII